MDKEKLIIPCFFISLLVYFIAHVAGAFSLHGIVSASRFHFYLYAPIGGDLLMGIDLWNLGIYWPIIIFAVAIVLWVSFIVLAVRAKAD